MKLNKLTIVRFFLAILTILAIVLHPKIPPKTVLLHPLDETNIGIYGQQGQFNWVNEDQYKVRCRFERKLEHIPCGIILTWEKLQDSHLQAHTVETTCVSDKAGACTQHEAYPLNFEDFDGLNVNINYEGSAQWLDIKLGNFEPEIAAMGNDPTKPMTSLIHTKDLKAGPVFIKFSEFIVHEWWIWGNDAPRHLASPDTNRIIGISVDNVEHGTHNTQLERVELVGERLKKNELMTILASFWLAYLLFEAAIKYSQLHISSRKDEEAIRQLKNEAIHLEEERSELETQSITDSLTGALNRNGLVKSTEQIFRECGGTGFGVLVIDIDHFKAINDNYGHDVGDVILKTLSALIQDKIRADDIFSRWGGEEFVLICHEPNIAGLYTIAEKLRAHVEKHDFSMLETRSITISIGLTLVRQGDTFENSFRRADKALYKAKENRNCVRGEE